MTVADVASATVVLAHPNRDEQVHTWEQTRPSWGPTYTAQGYIEREDFLLKCPLAKDGGLTSWILTDSSAVVQPDKKLRPILSSCETYRKRAVVRGTDGVVRDVTAHGIASVFTFEDCRRRGYANKMLQLVGEEFAKEETVKAGAAQFSVLFSDIGKKFYGDLGWKPFPSTHLSFPTKPFVTGFDDRLTPIDDDNLASLAELDERVLRIKMQSPPTGSAKVRAAILPDYNTLEWHIARETYMANHVFNSNGPKKNGVLYTPAGHPNQRVWGIWSAIWYGGRERPEMNVLNFLRFGVEDDNISDQELSKAIKAIIGAAHSMAHEWLCTKVDMWNPDTRTQKLISAMPELDGELVHREKTNIASLRWFGEGSVDDVEWVANEKFEWC